MDKEVLHKIIDIKTKISALDIDNGLKNELVMELDYMYNIIYDKFSNIKQELINEKLKYKNNILNVKSLVYIVICCNLLLFPLINFIALLYDRTSPQIQYEIETLVKLTMSIFGIGG